jgi:hypothetical protein
VGLTRDGLGEYFQSLRDEEDRNDPYRERFGGEPDIPGAVQAVQGLEDGLGPEEMVRLDPSLIVEEAGVDAPIPLDFHIGKCTADDCAYGLADQCPEYRPVVPVADPDRLAPGEGETVSMADEYSLQPGTMVFRGQEDGRLSILIATRTVERGGRLNPLELPAGRVEDLEPAEAFHVWWDIGRSEYRATPDATLAKGSARINLGTVS